VSSPRILFVGSIAPFLTTAARLDAMRELGLTVEELNQDPFIRSNSRALNKLAFLSLRTPGTFAFNRAILTRCKEFRPDIVWIEKGTYVFPSTVRRIRSRNMRLVYHNTDDWRSATRMHRLHWRYLLRALPDYDLHVTSNLHNVREFQEQGLPRVHHMELAANPAIRHPGELSESERESLGAPVGFIGHWEPYTERLLGRLVSSGVPLKIFGGGWNNAAQDGPLDGAIQHRLVWGDEYAKAIVAFDINLGIVSKWNRNHTASRTFQIPALGSFLLHERNELVARYFREGVEAEFFDSEDELIEKCRHYLEHPEERQRVAEAGMRRCHESGYFEIDRVRELLPELQALVGADPGGS
jgi:hypothetical protein